MTRMGLQLFLFLCIIYLKTITCLAYYCAFTFFMPVSIPVY